MTTIFLKIRVKGGYLYEHHFSDEEKESQKGFHITHSLSNRGRIQTLALNSRDYHSASVWTILYCPVLSLLGLQTHKRHACMPTAPTLEYCTK